MRERISRILRNISKIRTKRRMISPWELFVRQGLDPGPSDEILRYGGNRMDITIRYLAVECYYGKNGYGLELYKKMQVGRHKVQPVPEAVERFIKLLRSVEENGFDSSSFIEVDSNCHCINGAHRLALAMYFDVESVPCTIRPYREMHCYDISWLIDHSFTVEEINTILRKSDELYARALGLGKVLEKLPETQGVR